MNRLNKIILSCVLPFFFLLISVSYADLIDAPTSTMLTITKTGVSPSYNYSYGGYTYGQISTISKNYGSNPNNETYLETFNTMVSAIENAGYNIICWKGSDNYYYYTVFPKGVEVGISNYIMKTLLYDISNKTYSYEDFFCMCSYPEYTYATSNNDFSNYDTLAFKFNSTSLQLDTFYSKVSIKNLSFDSGSYVWDGTYFYEASVPEEPPIVEDLQLKNIIDELFTSNTFLSFPDSWRNNFFIIYNKSSNTYEIIVAPDYVYFRGYKYLKDNNDYYRVLAGSSPNFDTYDFSNLVNNNYTEYTNPLGSFNFYKFIYECDEEGNVINRYNRTLNNMTSDKTEYLTENQVLVYTRRNIPFYTLNDNGSFSEDTTSSLPSTELRDENGEVIVITPPKQPQDEIINDADFGDLSDSFEEHKSIFSFTENMQWLILANNKLSNYFLGIIVMCALFITLGRVLKG